ncbi:hypothetical protein MRB53_010845 [Persea americana]|uniref:Uncharacterized protein n=1 Tax=Persea americana TaxID=3435 RepID=A0ACC2LTA4_PERAE|nr:hypothetical protein MRB53_010845 [Persea americana]|eukprot:TRINITY_DN4836_c1_g1_i5.p1 TRINITY_DN4836_c1_g1~~TRINITY_DN4836_c1_g1_i5.p1  ORF type:complete len:324 (+),score=67.57 TRINITY_DN4836_c1_g1_i5:99-974(+)
METIFSPSTFCPLFSPKPPFSKTLASPCVQPKSPSLLLPKATISNLKSPPPQSLPQPKSWFSHVHHGLAALALSLAMNFCPVSLTDPAIASEFDVINEGPPTQSYVVDDAGVLSRVTKSDLKQMMSDLESRKNLHINFVTVRKLTSKADAFEYADQVLEKWYPTVEEGNNKGIVVLVTSQKEGAITGGPKFIQTVGDTILDSTVSENLPVLATDEKYNEAMLSTAKRLLAAIDGLPDPGGPQFKDNKRESNFKTKEETAEKRGQFTLVVGGLLVIAFVVPMAQYYAYVSKK